MDETQQDARAERSFGANLGRPLGSLAAVVGGGGCIAALGHGQLAWAVLWAVLGGWGLAAWAIGRESAGADS